ncbi:chromosome segregation protein SMC [Parvularcula lutaonensis]|uniref:Chromosome partition protein Smc n=1 Tax=Parvularcula lutaonensis TaxID=491923 RepID=A0ABV7M8I2_9PROT|nr:chromosome segregation protein SMC [Parvularcula lutaonensis]GGY42135.1 chromosome partition protein Smc [Parvularcula lutaonensis]
MRFERLRLCGFKSFVEPVDIEIKPGLTGIVGPNGCGKSNLVEGLRWLMGANSAKAMRASGMDEVIFAGTTGGRPARSWAEVTLEIDNSQRRAPAQFNDSDQLTVSRRVVRRADGSVSQYSINGKEVRARDVQMLFADASTGATSPALVRQGQISELINAKPTDRRRFLEEAAGVTGLAARRHEAQLRLNAAADNLERLDDVIGELDVQAEQLARQARKAEKYRTLSEEIKEVGKALSISRVRESYKAHEALDRQTSERRGAVADAVEAAARADRLATEGADKLEDIREKEREASMKMTKAEAALRAFETNEAMRKRAAEERERSLQRFAADQEREGALVKEADEAIAAAETRIQHLKSEIAEEADTKIALEEAATKAEAAAAEAEALFEAAQRKAAELIAEARAARQSRQEAEDRVAAAKAERARLNEKLAALPTLDDGAFEHAALEAERTREALAEAEQTLRQRNEELDAARRTSTAADEAFREAKERLRLLENEAKVLAPLIPTPAEDAAEGETALTAISAPEELRAGLAAALGDALHAAIGDEADHAWTQLGQDAEGIAPLPAGVQSLASLLTPPPALRRSFAAIGLVEGTPTDEQLEDLAPGQLIINRQGHLWRWDGYRRRSAADRHLEELLAASSRLRAIEDETEEARAALAQAQLEAETARRNLKEAEAALALARSAQSQAVTAERHAEQHLAKLTRDSDAIRLRKEALDEQLAANAVALTAAERRLSEIGEQVDTPQVDEKALDEARAVRDEARRRASQARGQAAEHRRKSVERRDALRREEGQAKAWRDRRTAAAQRLEQLAEQKAILEDEVKQASTEESDMAAGEALELAAFEAKSAWEKTRDALAEAQQAQSAAEKERRETEARASAAREALAELGAELKAAKARLDETLEEANISGDNIRALLAATGEVEPVDVLSRKLEKLERERERLGAVNLLAADEQSQVNERLGSLRSEREDCEAAANQLKTAVNAINREGRQRLLAAFEAVNGHFRELFTSLFNGGEAHLKFIDSDDPLTAGLEIFACPPGKKLQSLSLMSGGEQALTATALIFAAFRTNPAPICVLDEVDAPLDDANVERFCDLLSLMAKSSTTRFLVVTHHPLTMSRMDRLFGVTMMERGVSQLFSLDLESARRLAA